MPKNIKENVMLMMNNLYQIGNLKRFAQGELDGFITISEIKQYGDTGIGTFHAADGEMIVLDGTTYHVPWNGKASVALAEDKTPLVNLCTFRQDYGIDINNVSGIHQVERVLSEVIESDSYYMAKGYCNCASVHVRSAYKQEKPYRPLAEFLKTDETSYMYENVSGWMIGLYCPDRIGEYNAHGWHFHFLSEDKSFGGHIKEIHLEKAEIALMAFSDITIL